MTCLLLWVLCGIVIARRQAVVLLPCGGPAMYSAVAVLLASSHASLWYGGLLMLRLVPRQIWAAWLLLRDACQPCSSKCTCIALLITQDTQVALSKVKLLSAVGCQAGAVCRFHSSHPAALLHATARAISGEDWPWPTREGSEAIPAAMRDNAA